MSDAHISPSYTIKLVGGNGNRKLVSDIGKELSFGVEDADVSKFADGEVKINIKNNIRGSDAFAIQSCCGKSYLGDKSNSVNDNFMELLLLINTMKLASCKRVTVVMPYYPYSRQDRKIKPRVPISASSVAQLIEAMKPDRILTLDLHCGQIQGFFHGTPVDNLYPDNVFVPYLKSRNDYDWKNTVIVSPDAGGVGRAKRIADKVGGIPVVTILKRRVVENEIDTMEVIGHVEGMRCIITDDMIDTAGTLCTAAEHLKSRGAVAVCACVTHGVFSPPAFERINKSVIEQIIVTDSIPQERNVELCPKLRVLSVAPLLADTIRRIHEEDSVSSVFN